MIELKEIVREYRNGDVVTPALTGIDLCIRKGEFVAVKKTELVNHDI